MTARWTGGDVGARATCVLAPNPGPMTLEGTNTWVLLEPGASTAVVVDPGPDDDAHLGRVLDLLRHKGAKVGQVLLTHGHADHSDGARAFAQRSGAPVRALDPRHRLGDEGLADGDRLSVGGLRLEVVGTPGHTADSLSFVLTAEAMLLTGDTVLGRGSTVVAHPDGRLDRYLESLESLRRRVSVDSLRQVLPGHGPALPDASAAIEGYLAHRRQRLEQVRAALESGARDARQVVELVYADVDPALWPAAELSVLAQLEYLQQ